MSAKAESHSARYFALLYASAAERPALEALLGIEREVFDSLRAGLDHHVAHSRLQWWREECERAASGRAVHPLTRALALAVPLPKLAGLCGIVDVAIWDLAGATFETRRELDAYCQRWAAGMIEPLVGASVSTEAPVSASASSTDTPVSASASSTDAIAAVAAGSGFADHAGGSTSVPIAAEWRALGAAMREIELLEDLAREAHYGRIRLPLDELESANVDTNALAKPPWPEAVAAIIRTRLRSLRNDIERNVANVELQQQPAFRGLLVWAALAWRSSRRDERALPDRLQPGRFDAISGAWFAWRVARRATIGRFSLE